MNQMQIPVHWKLSWSCSWQYKSPFLPNLKRQYNATITTLATDTQHFPTVVDAYRLYSMMTAVMALYSRQMWKCSKQLHMKGCNGCDKDPLNSILLSVHSYSIKQDSGSQSICEWDSAVANICRLWIKRYIAQKGKYLIWFCTRLGIRFLSANEIWQ